MSNYYISNQGNDSQDGLRMSSAWKTIDRVNEAILKPGDGIFFRCGDFFNGELVIQQSGTIKEPIVIRSYGEGEKPILSGAIPATDWKAEPNNFYSTKIAKPVYQFFFNNKRLDLARIPSRGFFSVETGDKNSLTDHQHLNLPYDLTGAVLRIRAVNWQYETNQVAAHKGGTITFAESMMYQATPRYGYFLDNKRAFLTQAGQWFWDKESRNLLFLPPLLSNPTDEKAEAVVCKNGLTIAQHVSHLSIFGLQFEKYENAAILGQAGSSNISICDCHINDVNVYGVCLEINSSKYTIQNNTITNISGRGISTLESSHNQMVGNRISRIGLHPGYGFDGVNNGIGIAVLKTEAVYKITDGIFQNLKNSDIPTAVLEKVRELVDLPYPDEKFVIEVLEQAIAAHYLPIIMPLVNAEAKAQRLESTHNRVAYNVVDQSGYAGIRLDGCNSIAECNVIKNSLLHMNDGGALYCWAQNQDYTHHNVIRNNIIINAIGSCEATSNDLAYAYGIYTDNKCHHITIENNTVVGTVGGILINDEAHHQKIIGNTLYDNQMGLVFSEYFMPDTLVGCEAYDNILFAKKRDQRALFVESRIRENFLPALLDKNLYANPYYPFPILALTYKDHVRSFKEYTLKSWQKHYGQDSASTTIATDNHDAGGQKSHILINETNTFKSFEIPTDLVYTDLGGKVLKGTVDVNAFSSFIILQK